MHPARPTTQPPTLSPPPQPGPDEILVSRPAARLLCNDRGHRRMGVLAEVLVTFGTFGSHWHHDAFWPEVWGRTYPLCGECWPLARDVVQHARPRLVIREVPTL